MEATESNWPLPESKQFSPSVVTQTWKRIVELLAWYEGNYQQKNLPVYVISLILFLFTLIGFFIGVWNLSIIDLTSLIMCILVRFCVHIRFLGSIIRQFNITPGRGRLGLYRRRHHYSWCQLLKLGLFVIIANIAVPVYPFILLYLLRHKTILIISNTFRFVIKELGGSGSGSGSGIVSLSGIVSRSGGGISIYTYNNNEDISTHVKNIEYLDKIINTDTINIDIIKNNKNKTNIKLEYKRMVKLFINLLLALDVRDKVLLGSNSTKSAQALSISNSKLIDRSQFSQELTKLINQGLKKINTANQHKDNSNAHCCRYLKNKIKDKIKNNIKNMITMGNDHPMLYYYVHFWWIDLFTIIICLIHLWIVQVSEIVRFIHFGEMTGAPIIMIILLILGCIGTAFVSCLTLGNIVALSQRLHIHKSIYLSTDNYLRHNILYKVNISHKSNIDMKEFVLKYFVDKYGKKIQEFIFNSMLLCEGGEELLHQMWYNDDINPSVINLLDIDQNGVPKDLIDLIVEFLRNGHAQDDTDEIRKILEAYGWGLF